MSEKAIGLLENFQWAMALLALLILPVLSFIGQKSHIKDSDIQIKEVTSAKKQEEALKSVLKYLKGKARQEFLAQIQAAKARAKQKKNIKRPRSNTRYTANNPWIREAPESGMGYLPPNTHVKYISSDFKMKYASSLQETFQILRQAGSRFIRTPEGPRPVITWITPGTIIHRLGFRPGDVILRVNGRPISSVRDSRTLYNALKNDQQYLVEVLRQGKLHRFIFKIEN